MLRWSALLSVAALLLHEVQYRATYGVRAEEALGAHGHAYLSWAIGLVTALSVLALTRLALEVRGARRRGRDVHAPRGISFARAWTWSTVALTLAYLLQEAAEGALAAGHPGLVHALASHNGWLSLLLALALGALVAFLLRGAHAAVEAAARRRRSRTPVRSTPAFAAPAARRPRPSLDVLAFHLAGRGPPLARGI